MTPRGTDWSLGALTALLVASGLGSWVWAAGWIVVVHDVAGLGLTAIVVIKFRRVWGRLARGAWDRRTRIGLSALLLVWMALGSGVVWSSSRVTLLGFTLLAWHTVIGAALGLAVLAHLIVRAKKPRRKDVTNRRQALQLGGTFLAAFLAWWTQDPVTRALGLGGSSRRFTGSYEQASFTGNAFPTTSWVADSPAVLDAGAWRLRVGGACSRPLEIGLPRLDAVGDVREALLDCTGGFHSTQEWHGVRLDRLLAVARPLPSATHVRITGVTGYRWWFRLSDAPSLLLATRVGGEPLSHGHGAPLRLVAPGRRGFQWVKWVVAVELLEGPDLGAPASTVLSSF